jgi:hypothetical protein
VVQPRQVTGSAAGLAAPGSVGLGGPAEAVVDQGSGWRSVGTWSSGTSSITVTLGPPVVDVEIGPVERTAGRVEVAGAGAGVGGFRGVTASGGAA